MSENIEVEACVDVDIDVEDCNGDSVPFSVDCSGTQIMVSLDTLLGVSLDDLKIRDSRGEDVEFTRYAENEIELRAFVAPRGCTVYIVQLFGRMMGTFGNREDADMRRLQLVSAVDVGGGGYDNAVTITETEVL